MKIWLLDTNAIVYPRNNVGGVCERLNLRRRREDRDEHVGHRRVGVRCFEFIDRLRAAPAIESEATLVTNDGALLARDIPGLDSEDWTQLSRGGLLFEIGQPGYTGRR